MRLTRHSFRYFTALPLLLAIAASGQLHAQTTTPAQNNAALIGHWRINSGLSDNTDREVEKAMEKSGFKIKSSGWFDSRKDKYRGGPPEQELYDRFSYDPVLTISEQPNGYQFEYADNYRTTVYTDNRSHTVSLNSLEKSEDFLEGHWEGGKLLVEMHPRDGGYTYATYSITDAGKRLHAEYVIKPGSFNEEFKLERVYDRTR